MRIDKTLTQRQKLLDIMDINLMEFLQENNALEKFINNLNPDRRKTISHKIFDMQCEFVWAESPEKDSFWRELNKKFKGHY